MTRPEVSAPRYASVMVHVDLLPYSLQRVALAAGLADRFEARLIGVASRQLIGSAAEGGYVAEADSRRAERDLEAARRSFFDAAGSRNDVQWRAALDAPDRYLPEQARCADIVVVGRQATYDPRDPALGVLPGAVVMECGRPLLIVPPEIDHLSIGTIVVAWKDTREARRAVNDALPLLVQANEVVVVTATSSFTNESVEDVAAWLVRHGANSRPLVSASGRPSVAEEVLDVATDLGAGLIVSGAYGHSRTREWFFGGATRDLLETAPIPLLLSH